MNKQTASASPDKAPISTSAQGGAKPDAAKPDAMKPDAMKPDAMKPDAANAKTADSIAESVQTLVDQGAETFDTIKARVSEATDGARTQAARVVDRTTELVIENPMKSLGIAFGIGYIAMRITTSRLTSIAMIGGVIYAGTRLFGRDATPVARGRSRVSR